VRTLDEYMRLPWTIVVRYHAEQGGYWSAEVAELPGCLYATRDRSELLSELDVAMRLMLESMIKHGDPIPEPSAAPV
jgi:predicted RNase H-like HicB family nuclease